MKRNIFSLLIFVLIAMNSYSQGINPALGDYHVRIAFIGNSITIGTNLTNPTVESYPGRVSQMLQTVYGDTCVVSNFAVSGRTMLKKGDFPIWNEPQFGQMWNFAPDIVYIMMGTNDTKPQNWDVCGPGQFFADYKAMIDTMRVRNPKVKFMCAFPPPCYKTGDLTSVWLINDSIISHGVIPIVDSLAKLYNIPVVDFNTALRDSGCFFPDQVHPNAHGASVMGKLVFDKFIETDIVHQVEKGNAFVTGITTASRIVAEGDSVTLSWTTINSDSAFFEGKKVDLNGSVRVSTAVKNVYTVYAYGPKSIDSLKFTQPVYVPVFTKLGINTKSVKLTQGDSVKFDLLFYDQQNKILTGKSFDVTWTITSGVGYLTDKTNTSAIFVGSEVGKATVNATVGSLSVETRISITARVGILNSNSSFENKFYPNPVKGLVTFKVETNNTKPVEIRVFDMKGAIQLKEDFSISKAGIQTFHLKTNNLKAGIYFFEVEGQDLNYKGKFRQK